MGLQEKVAVDHINLGQGSFIRADIVIAGGRQFLPRRLHTRSLEYSLRGIGMRLSLPRPSGLGMCHDGDSTSQVRWGCGIILRGVGGGGVDGSCENRESGEALQQPTRTLQDVRLRVGPGAAAGEALKLHIEALY